MLYSCDALMSPVLLARCIIVPLMQGEKKGNKESRQDAKSALSEIGALQACVVAYVQPAFSIVRLICIPVLLLKKAGHFTHYAAP